MRTLMEKEIHMIAGGFNAEKVNNAGSELGAAIGTIYGITVGFIAAYEQNEFLAYALMPLFCGTLGYVGGAVIGLVLTSATTYLGTASFNFYQELKS